MTARFIQAVLQADRDTTPRAGPVVEEPAGQGGPEGSTRPLRRPMGHREGAHRPPRLLLFRSLGLDRLGVLPIEFLDALSANPALAGALSRPLRLTAALGAGVELVGVAAAAAQNERMPDLLVLRRDASALASRIRRREAKPHHEVTASPDGEAGVR